MIRTSPRKIREAHKAAIHAEYKIAGARDMKEQQELEAEFDRLAQAFTALVNS